MSDSTFINAIILILGVLLVASYFEEGLIVAAVLTIIYCLGKASKAK